MTNLLKKAFDPNIFRHAGHKLIDMLADQLEGSHNTDNFHTINRKSPDEQLAGWNDDFRKPHVLNPVKLFNEIIGNSVNLHSPGYLGHQVSPTVPLTTLSSALMAFLNNGMAVYEMGMAGNAMEKIVTDYLAAKFGFDKQA